MISVSQIDRIAKLLNTLKTIWQIIEAIKAGRIKGEDIFYVNADDSFKGLTIKTELAEQYGFNMLAPGHLDFKAEMVIEILAEMIKTDTASGKIFILDTVKKFTDLMDKGRSSKFGESVRQFISNGGTVISLAHVNKHRGNDGKVIYSGTTDLVDDGDCAFTIDVINHASDTKTVRFNNFKARGDVAQEVTFSYETGRGMTYPQRLESVKRLDDDQVKQAKTDQARKATYERNIEAIRAIREVLEPGPCRKTGQSFRPVKPFHQAAEPNLWVRSGEVEVYQVVQSLKILFCKIRISKAINALLESFWTSTTAADRSALGSST